MPRYINVSNLPNFEVSCSDGEKYVLLPFEHLSDIPTADVVEVKHGYWIDKPTGRYCHIGSYCSVCEEKSGIGGIESNRHKPYCPHCGAKMDGERTEK